MGGREWRAGMLFVLLSMLVGGAMREWRRSHQERFADLVARLSEDPSSSEVLGSAPREGDVRGGDADALGGEAGAPDGAEEPRPPARSGSGGAIRPAGLDLNRASAADLERLPGIGPSLAARILAERRARGGFRSPEDLLRVRGIGPKTLARIRPYLTDSPATPAPLTPPLGAK